MILTHLHRDGYLSRGERGSRRFYKIGYQGGNSLVGWSTLHTNVYPSSERGKTKRF